jgi:hypothetical protein
VREGLGLGERSSEIFVFIVVIAALVWAGRWYFVVYKNSPTAALMEYMQAVKASDVDAQYKMLSASTKKTYTDKSAYVDKWKIARGLQGRLIDYTIGKIEQKGEQADADVSVAIRKPGQEIYQAAAETVVDHYILVKDPAGWRVALDKCFDQIKSIKYATDFP